MAEDVLGPVDCGVQRGGETVPELPGEALGVLLIAGNIGDILDKCREVKGERNRPFQYPFTSLARYYHR